MNIKNLLNGLKNIFFKKERLLPGSQTAKEDDAHKGESRRINFLKSQEEIEREQFKELVMENFKKEIIDICLNELNKQGLSKQIAENPVVKRDFEKLEKRIVSIFLKRLEILLIFNVQMSETLSISQLNKYSIYDVNPEIVEQLRQEMRNEIGESIILKNDGKTLVRLYKPIIRCIGETHRYEGKADIYEEIGSGVVRTNRIVNNKISKGDGTEVYAEQLDNKIFYDANGKEGKAYSSEYKNFSGGKKRWKDNKKRLECSRERRIAGINREEFASSKSTRVDSYEIGTYISKKGDKIQYSKRYGDTKPKLYDSRNEKIEERDAEDFKFGEEGFPIGYCTEEAKEVMRNQFDTNLVNLGTCTKLPFLEEILE